MKEVGIKKRFLGLLIFLVIILIALNIAIRLPNERDIRFFVPSNYGNVPPNCGNGIYEPCGWDGICGGSGSADDEECDYIKTAYCSQNCKLLKCAVDLNNIKSAYLWPRAGCTIPRFANFMNCKNFYDSSTYKKCDYIRGICAPSQNYATEVLWTEQECADYCASSQKKYNVYPKSAVRDFATANYYKTCDCWDDAGCNIVCDKFNSVNYCQSGGYKGWDTRLFYSNSQEQGYVSCAKDNSNGEYESPSKPAPDIKIPCSTNPSVLCPLGEIIASADVCKGYRQGQIDLILDQCPLIGPDEKYVAMFGDADELKIRATAKLNGALSPNSNCKIKLTAERRELSGVYTSQVSTLCIGQTTCSLDFNLYKPTDIAKYNYFVDVSATASPECRLDSPFDGTTLLIRKNPKTKVFAFRGNGGFGQGTSPLQIIESVLNKEAFDFEVASYDAIVTGGVEGNPAEDISEFAKTDLMQSSSSDPSCKRYRSIILFGFSNGGHAALDVARKLGMSDVETDMIFLIDPVPWPPSAIESSCRFFIPHPCVRSWINYYQNVDTSIFSFMMTQRGRTLDGGGNNLRDYIEYPGASCSTSEITWPEKAHTLMPCHKSIVDSGVNVIKDAILMKESYSCNPSLARLPDVMTCGG